LGHLYWYAFIAVLIQTSLGRAEKTRLFEFSYKAKIEKAPLAKEVRLWLPYPQTDENQEILDMEVKAPAGASVYREPLHNNLILYVSVGDPGVFPMEVEMRFKILRREYVHRDFDKAIAGADRRMPAEIEKYRRPTAREPLNEQIRVWAEEVTRGKKTDLEKARAIYDYALANLKYDKSGKGWGQGDLLYICDQKRGNCTDFHALFSGFTRAVGIPARFSIGFPLPETRGEGEIPGYHCWAEFYLNGYGWVPIDASEAWKNPAKREYFFGAHDENRVQFSTGRDLVLRPRQSGRPLNYFIYPYGEADGKPVEGISYKFYFQDIPSEESGAGKGAPR
jgi:transglutaminase-like putative cysteine protease